MDRALGIIPCRGGSKGLPGKHLLEIGGITLLERAVSSAYGSELLTRVVVTSDSPELIYHAMNHDNRVLGIHRPAELATDTAGMIPVLQHAVRYLGVADPAPYDLVVCLQPTSPFRTGEDIDACIALVRDSGAESAQTLCEAAYRPWAMVQLSGDRCLPLYPALAGSDLRRQDPPGVYQPSGAVYVTRRHVLMEGGRIIGTDHRGVVMPWERSINVNTPWDFRIAEMIHARNFQP